MNKKIISKKSSKKEVSTLSKLPMWCLFLRELNKIDNLEDKYTYNVARIINAKYGNSTYTFLVLVRNNLIKEKLVSINKLKGVRKAVLTLTPRGLSVSNKINDLLNEVDNA